MKIKTLLIIFGIMIVLAGIASLTIKDSDDLNGKDSVVCTQDAKLCSDGSYVSRSGPKCEFTPCPTMNGRIAGGYVSGHITIGPNCPVEQAGVPCEPSPEAFTSREIVIYKSDGDLDFIEIERVHLDQQGNYKIALGPGKYLAQIQPAGIGEGEKKPLTIISFETTIVNFDIDTGIR